jgi:transposase
VVEGAINTEMTIKMFNAFAQTLTKQTVVILGNATSHISKLFQDHIPGWRQRGLLIHYILAHCPQLNYIEMLWHKIKYEWLEIEAFASKESLLAHLNDILKKIGQKYRITFS